MLLTDSEVEMNESHTIARWLVRCVLMLLPLAAALSVPAQERMHIHTRWKMGNWDFPYIIDSVKSVSLSGDNSQLLIDVIEGVTVPFSREYIDSITIEKEPLEETKDKYQVFQMYITTNDGEEVTSRDYYRDCYISLNAKGAFTSFSAGAKIRGRGNSTFLWYEKKPYRIKLNKKHKLLGLGQAKSWVLLANYRDITDLMNTFVFEMGEWMGLPFTNHTRYVELFLNGDYKGVYQLTEQVQQGKNRVDVSDDKGILITLDVDDGPNESPYANDNFFSKVYHMPVAVKYPDDEHATMYTCDSVKAVFAQLEQAIKDQNYERVEQLLDIPSMIKYLQIQEFVYNVELSAPRSIFMYKDGDGRWVMGPLWDFDAGYDFDWSNMYTGHRYFDDYTETVMGTNPFKRNGNYHYVPQFFTDLFGCREFVEAYKEHWLEVKDSIVTRNWNECMKYVENLQNGTMEREDRRWTIVGKYFNTEVEKMHQWLLNRADFMTNLIANIPVPKRKAIPHGERCGINETNLIISEQ